MAAERHGREVVYRLTDPKVREMLAVARRMRGTQCDHLASCERVGPDWI